MNKKNNLKYRMVQHRPSHIENKDRSDRTSSEFKEWLEETSKSNAFTYRDYINTNGDVYNFDVYDDIVRKVETSKDCNKETVTTMYEKTISGPCKISINSSIKYDMSSMKIFFSVDKVDLSHLEILKDAVYELRLGGQRIKMGYLTQGLDIIEDTFTPFNTAAQWHYLDLCITINNNELPTEVKLQVNIVMDTYHLSEEIKNDIKQAQITVPWKSKTLDGKMAEELLHFRSGMGGMLISYPESRSYS